MGMPQRWFNKVRQKLLRLSPTDTVVLHSNAIPGADEAKSSEATEDITNYQRLNSEITWPSTKELTREARRAFRALRSLVKLQALAGGAYVRKQSRITLHCMHALVRLQVRVRARPLLVSRCSDDQ